MTVRVTSVRIQKPNVQCNETQSQTGEGFSYYVTDRSFQQHLSYGSGKYPLECPILMSAIPWGYAGDLRMHRGPYSGHLKQP